MASRRCGRPVRAAPAAAPARLAPRAPRSARRRARPPRPPRPPRAPPVLAPRGCSGSSAPSLRAADGAAEVLLDARRRAARPRWPGSAPPTPSTAPRVRAALRRDLAPGVAAFVGVSARPRRAHRHLLPVRAPARARPTRRPSSSTTCWPGSGQILARVAVPLLVSVLLAAKLGASTAAHLGPHEPHAAGGRAPPARGPAPPPPAPAGRRRPVRPRRGCTPPSRSWSRSSRPSWSSCGTTPAGRPWLTPAPSSATSEPPTPAGSPARWALSRWRSRRSRSGRPYAPKRAPEDVVAAIHATLLWALLAVLGDPRRLRLRRVRLSRRRGPGNDDAPGRGVPGRPRARRRRAPGPYRPLR